MSDLASASAALRRLVDNVERVIAGAHPVVEAAVACLFADGNLLLEGVPGVGKDDAGPGRSPVRSTDRSAASRRRRTSCRRT
jgi:hypothetical protein